MNLTILRVIIYFPYENTSQMGSFWLSLIAERLFYHLFFLMLMMLVWSRVLQEASTCCSRSMKCLTRGVPIKASAWEVWCPHFGMGIGTWGQ